MLLFALVDNGDAIGEHGEGDGIFIERDVQCVGGEAGVVVVHEEGAEESGIGVVGLHGVDAVIKVADAAGGGLEGLCDPEVAARVVQ